MNSQKNLGRIALVVDRVEDEHRVERFAEIRTLAPPGPAPLQYVVGRKP